MKFLMFIMVVMAVLVADATGIDVAFRSSGTILTSAYTTVSGAILKPAIKLQVVNANSNEFYLSWAKTCGALSSSGSTLLIGPSAVQNLDIGIITGSCIGVKAITTAASGALDINMLY